MNKLELEKRVKITSITFNADDYELFSDESDREAVAAALNGAIMQAVNSCSNAGEAYKRIAKVQSAYARAGAYDSEPTRLIESVLDQCY